MYNKEIKARYIEEIRAYKDRSLYNTYVSIFSASEPFENEYKRDVAAFYRSQMANLEDTDAIKEIAPMKYKAAILQYIDWYRRHIQDPDNSGSAKSWVMDSLQPYKDSIVSSPAHLQKVLDIVFDSVESGTIDIIYRTYFWIAFAGLRERDRASLVTTKDVRLDDMEIRFDGYSYPIYSEGFKAIKAAKCADAFVYNHPNYTTTRTRVDGDKLLRGVRADADSSGIRRKIREKIAEATKVNDSVTQISYRTVLHSGIFYRQYQDEVIDDGSKIDFKGIVKPTKNGVAMRQDCLISSACRVNNSLKSEYYLWKYLLYKDKV